MENENNLEMQSREIKSKIITEEQANELVYETLDFMKIENIISFQKYPCEGDYPFTYQVVYERNYQNEIHKVLLPISMDMYIDLLRCGLSLKGYNVKEIKRRLSHDILSFSFSYYVDDLQKQKQL